MIFYAIRHKATGDLMPELTGGRGYSHWNPTNKETYDDLRRILTGTPRLLSSRRKALMCIAQWFSLPNGIEKRSYNSGYYGDEEDVIIQTTPDGRSKDDLEVVEIHLEVVEP